MFQDSIETASKIWTDVHKYWLYENVVYKEHSFDANFVRGFLCCRRCIDEDDPWEGPPEYDETLLLKKEDSQCLGYFPVDLTHGWWRSDADAALEQWDDGEFWIPVVELERQYRKLEPAAPDFMAAIDEFKNIKNYQNHYEKPTSNPLKIPNPTNDPLIDRMIYEARQCLAGNYLFVACVKGIHRGKVFSMEGTGRSGWIRGTLAYTPERRMGRNRVCGQSEWSTISRRVYDIPLDNCVIISK